MFFWSNNLELKLWWGLLTLQSCGHYWYLGKPMFYIPFSHRMSHIIFSGHGKKIIFIFLTSNKEIIDDSMIWTRIRTSSSNWGGLPGSVVPYTTYCFVRKGGFDCQQLPPHMNCLVNTYKELIVRTPYGCNLLNRHKKHRVLFVKDENWKGT